MSIVETIDGTPILDGEGNVAEERINCGTLPLGTHESHWFDFRLPQGTRQPVYLRIWQRSPLSWGDSIYVDEMVVIKGTELYTEGPFVAVVSGITPSVTEDEWTLTVTNDRAGAFQEWFHRAFDMRAKRLLLPSSGTIHIADTLIA